MISGSRRPFLVSIHKEWQSQPPPLFDKVVLKHQVLHKKPNAALAQLQPSELLEHPTDVSKARPLASTFTENPHLENTFILRNSDFKSVNHAICRSSLLLLGFWVSFLKKKVTHWTIS